LLFENFTTLFILNYLSLLNRNCVIAAFYMMNLFEFV